MNIKIGVWHETESRELTQHTEYAADYIIHKSKIGEYDATLTFGSGFLFPMPQWLLIGIDTDIIDGELFSGFGGVNFASTKVKKEQSLYLIQMYEYFIPDLVKSGRLSLLPEWEWLNNDTKTVFEYIKTNNISWDYLSKLCTK